MMLSKILNKVVFMKNRLAPVTASPKSQAWTIFSALVSCQSRRNKLTVRATAANQPNHRIVL